MIGILNNEALGMIAIQAVLAVMPRINIANSYLIVPLLFDKKIRTFLKRKDTEILSVQEVVTMKNDYFIGFNEKFNDSLIVTTNAIVMAKELNLIQLNGMHLSSIEQFSITKRSVSKKVDDIVLASPNVASMLSEPPDSIYSLLRIKL